MVRSAYTLPSVLTPSLPAGFPNCRPPFSNCFSKSLFEGGKPSRFSLVWKCPHFVFVLDRQFCGCTTLGRLTDLPTALQTYLVAARLPTVSCHEQIVIPPSLPGWETRTPSVPSVQHPPSLHRGLILLFPPLGIKCFLHSCSPRAGRCGLAASPAVAPFLLGLQSHGVGSLTHLCLGPSTAAPFSLSPCTFLQTGLQLATSHSSGTKCTA